MSKRKLASRRWSNHRTSRSFTAKYNGYCSVCKKPTRKGEQLQIVRNGAPAHFPRCPNSGANSERNMK